MSTQGRPQRICPNCRKSISATASHCMYCGNVVPPIPDAEAEPRDELPPSAATSTTPATSSTAQLADESIRCPYCAETIQALAQKCRFCGEWLKRDSHSSIDRSASPSKSAAQAAASDDGAKRLRVFSNILVVLVVGAVLVAGALYYKNAKGSAPSEMSSTDPPQACRTCCLRLMPWGGPGAVNCIEQCARGSKAVGKSDDEILANCRQLISATVPACDEYAAHVGKLSIQAQQTPRSERRWAYEAAALACSQMDDDEKVCAMLATTAEQTRLCNKQ